MPSTRPLRTRRAVRLAVIAVVALFHLGLLLLASTWRRPEPPALSAPLNESFLVTPAAPTQESRAPLAKLPPLRRRKPRQAPQPAAPAVASPPLAPAPSGAVAGAQPRSSSGARDMADPWAVQEALRASVGCALEDLKLRSDERDRCNDRAGRWAKKAKKIGPAADDPRRAAELAAEEDYNRRYNAWKRTDSGTHNGSDWWDARGALGAMPPKKDPTPPPPDIPQ